MKSAEYLSFYAERFDSVEIDSTFYGCPTARTVASWYDKTPGDFTFSVKVPQAITHDRILADCQEEFATFVETVGLLREKLGLRVVTHEPVQPSQLVETSGRLRVLLPQYALANVCGLLGEFNRCAEVSFPVK